MVLCERHKRELCKTKNVQPVEIRVLECYYILAQNALYDICRRIIDIEVRNAALWGVFKTKRGGSWKCIDND